MLRRTLAIIFALAAALAPAASHGHLHQGHMIIGAGAFRSPQIASFTVVAGLRDGLGQIGIVTIDGDPIVATCVEIADDAGDHFVRIGWQDVGGVYELWIDADTGQPADVSLYRVTQGEPCSPQVGLGGLAGGTGVFAVIG